MEILNRYYPESKFGGFSKIDGTISFYLRVNALINPDDILLDVGCGRGAYQEDLVPYRRALQIMKGKVAEVIGIDVDPGAADNPFIDSFKQIDANNNWPLPDNSVDIILCDWVLEHIESPESFFSEAERVIKSGGVLCIRTTNRWGYVALFSSFIPTRFHNKILALLQKNRDSQDIFPTRYKCNTRRIIREYLYRYQFDPCVYSHQAEPSYFSSFRILYGFISSVQPLFLPFFYSSIFAFGKKQ